MLPTILAVLLVTASPAAAKKPDLVVGVGSSAAVSGANVTGSVTVRNAGRGRARATRVGLSLTSPGAKAQRVATLDVKPIKRGRARTATLAAPLPGGLTPGATYGLRACADAGRQVRERDEGNNCRRLASVVVPAAGGQETPAGPVDYTPDQPTLLNSAESPYWVVVPSAYTAATPTQLFVWMHGCGGESQGDAYTVAGSSYIAISLGGRDGACWDVETDQAKVLAAIANVKTHFTIDPKRIVLGGYSSGGDLAYRTAFYNSTMVAGVLAENTSPFRDTGSTQQASIAAATFKFHIVHLAHTEDDTYDIQGVRQETDALKAAGFPITRIERPGQHYDDKTDSDLQTLLLPRLADGWTSP